MDDYTIPNALREARQAMVDKEKRQAIIKMKCKGCGKESENELCPMCEIGMLEHDAETALQHLIEAYRKLLKIKSEV